VSASTGPVARVGAARGSSRVTPTVALRPRAAAGALLLMLLLLACRPSPVGAASSAGAASPRSGAVRVQVMVAGRSGVVLEPPHGVLAAAAHVRLTGHGCVVAAGTPLAVLVALRHAGGPGFTLRDYGHCDASPADSAQLFVTSIGGQRNGGQNGWEYKVNGRAGSTGAADPSGPLGNGRRLPAGAQVLWFYCQMSTAGCQRTLRVVPHGSSVAPGAPLPVSVSGYDDEGRAAPVAGAAVTLGPSTASSLGGGVATLTAPAAPGRYELSASAPGMAPPFPAAVQVR